MKRGIKYSSITLLLCFIVTTCYILYIAFYPSRELVAKRSVSAWLFELGINDDLFQGPILVEKNEKYSVFQFLSTVPKYGDTIIELSVAEGSKDVNGFGVKGTRPSFLHLSRTRHFPLNKAMLDELFSLPLSPGYLNEDEKRLIDVFLNKKQIEAVADFIEIKRQLGEYYFKYNIGYPDSLAELGTIQFPLEDIYTKNEMGNSYFYNQMSDYVILGDPGEDGKLDFESVLIDSVYANNRDFIFTSGNDILVKFKPVG